MTSPECTRRTWPTNMRAACALLGLLTLNVLWAKPDHNWDMLPYVAVAYQFAGESPAQAHARTFALVQQKLAASEHRQLTEGNDYRTAVARDPAAFNQQLPGYRVKVVYPWLIRQLTRFGLDPIRASVLISRLSYLAVGLVVLLWLFSWTGPRWAVAVSWAIMSLSFSIDLAQLSTPDAISTLVILAACLLMFEKGHSRAPLVLLIASVAVRPDNLLWLLAAAAYCVFRYPKQRTFAALSAASGLLLVFGLGRWADLPGWATLFHHAFVERVAYQEGFQPSLSPLGYVRVYLRETHPANLPQFVGLFGLIGSSLGYYRVRRYGWSDIYVALLTTMGVFGFMHWLLYPDDDRYFIAAYLMITIVLLRTLVFTRPSITDGSGAQLHASAHQPEHSLGVDAKQLP
ncbi:MAG: hypothetical protein ACRENP_06130 [Longimicrobiales bacterium]